MGFTSRSVTRRAEADQHGQVLVLFALGLVVFLAAAALTIDFGTWLTSRRSYQNAVDTAALAGAAYLTRPLNSPCGAVLSKQVCARRAAWGYLKDQLGLDLSGLGDVNGVAAANTPQAGLVVPVNGGGYNYTVWVDTPPSAAGTASQMSTVRDLTTVVFARADRRNDSFFGRVIQAANPTVSAWATAGVFPGRWAVITLRRGRGNTQIDNGPANTTDIKTAGTTSALNVVNGDVGGNWGMKLTANSLLRVYSTNGDPSAVYLTDYVSCGNSCWSNGQITDQFGNSLALVYPPSGARKLPAFIPDPNYLPPPGLNSNAPNSWVNNAAPTPDIPPGDATGGTPGRVTITRGQPNPTTGRCDPSPGDPAPPKIGPGWYSNIVIRQGACVVFDPLFRHPFPDNPASEVGTPPTPVVQNQMPGVFYVTGAINTNGSGGLLVGDGVTIVMRTNASFIPNSGGVMDLNTGKVSGGNGQKLGAWTTKGASSYAWNPVTLRWVYQSFQESNIPLYGRGLALYVLKPSQISSSSASDANTNVIQVNSGAGLAWNGVTYAPHDNVQIAGQPHHNGVGQLISWTFTFNGGTEVTQTYDGPDEGFPYLIEPCVQVSGACQ